jgi:ATP adenylyltransferase
MECLWAPWRIEYILGKRENYCIFCPEGDGHTDQERLILYRGRLTMVMMNKYPYNVGHLLILPRTHKGDIHKLTVSEWNDMNDVARRSLKIISACMPAGGFNIGLNLGAVAGAGIKEHIHIHVVPRFLGDANFICTVGNSRVQSISLGEVYDLLKPGFDRLREAN